MPKNSKPKNNQAQYKNKFKKLRAFVDFKIDLRKEISRADKLKITKYYKELERITAHKPYEIQIFRSNKRANLEKVKQLGGQNTKLKSFKVAFVPKTSSHQKIKFKNGEPQIISSYVEETYIPLDPLMLATENVVEYVDDVLKNRKENSFSIQAGDHQLKATFSKDTVASKIAQLCNDYNNEAKNDYFGNWLGGVFANDFKNQSDLISYKEAKRAAQIAKDRKKKKRESLKKIRVFYWYDRKQQTVLITKTEIKPNKNCEAITKKEYEKFLSIGEI